MIKLIEEKKKKKEAQINVEEKNERGEVGTEERKMEQREDGEEEGSGVNMIKAKKRKQRNQIKKDAEGGQIRR